MQPKKLKENTTPTPRLTTHGPDHVKWYFQCNHWCIGWPMLVKTWSASNWVVWTNKQERHNNEYKHTSCFKMSTGHKWVKVHDMWFVDLSWCYVTLTIISIHNILTKNCYNNGRLHMNCLWIFGSTSMICSFKLRRARWNFSIFGIDSSIVLRNLPIPSRSLNSIIANNSSMMDLRNHKWIQWLSQVTLCFPLIKKLHQCRVMWEIMLTHLFNCHILSTSLHLIFM